MVYLRDSLFDPGRIDGLRDCSSVASCVLPGPSMLGLPSGTTLSSSSLTLGTEAVAPLHLGRLIGGRYVVEELVERRVLAFGSILGLGGNVVRRQLTASRVGVRRHRATSATATATATATALSHPANPLENRAKNATGFRGGEGVASGLSQKSSEHLLRRRGVTVLVAQLDSRIVAQVPVIVVDVEIDPSIGAELADLQDGNRRDVVGVGWR